MKSQNKLALVVCSLCLLGALCLGTGCGKSDVSKAKPAAVTVGGVDVAPLEEAFKSSMSFRPMIDETVKIIQAARYPDALSALQRLAANPQVTPQQKEAVDALIVSIRQQAVSKSNP